jgi:hypothetical protein
MLKRFLSVALTLLLTNVAAISAYARAQSDEQLRKIEKVKASIQKLGTGEAARVEIKLRDRTKVKGYIREAGDNDFVVVNAKTGVVTTVPYSQVSSLQGNNRLTAAKVGINIAKGAAIVAAVAAAFTLLLYLTIPKT